MANKFWNDRTPRDPNPEWTALLRAAGMLPPEPSLGLRFWLRLLAIALGTTLGLLWAYHG